MSESDKRCENEICIFDEDSPCIHKRKGVRDIKVLSLILKMKRVAHEANVNHHVKTRERKNENVETT